MSSILKSTQKRCTRNRILIVIFCLIIIVTVSIVVPLIVITDSSNTPPIVETVCGPVKGLRTSAYVFKGIPYAKPPVANLRWKPPVPLTREDKSCWSGTFNAVEFGNMCVQFTTGLYGSEDCLYLNIWTPTLDRNASLPVMVWIHGGSLTTMSGNFPTYSPSEEIAVKTNMVHVSMNYRLNAFGFMALSERSPLNISGNFGFMDQLLALRWVQQNIRNFGGDSEMVTIYGQSSGATCVMVLLSSPLSKGLFHRAWLTSGSAVLNKTSQEAAKDNLLFLNNTRCSDTECLINLPAKEVIYSVPWFVYPSWGMHDLGDLPTRNSSVGALAVVDGEVLTMTPFETFKSGMMMDVPVIIGNTAQELDYGGIHADIASWSWDDYIDKVSAKLSTFPGLNISEVLQMYPVGMVTPEYQYTTMASDIRVTCPNNVLASKMESSFKSPVFRYVATAFPSEPAELYGFPFKSRYSAHGLDIFAFFNTLKDYYKTTVDDEKFTENMQREITHFAKSGRPQTASWLPFPDKVAIINDDITIADGFHKDKCSFWMREGFMKYSWIN